MNARNPELERLEAQLAGQLEALVIEAHVAARVARDRVSFLESGGAGEEDPPPWFVLPVSSGWTVTRAFAVTGTEVFERRDDAIRRARALASADEAEAVICNEQGQPAEGG